MKTTFLSAIVVAIILSTTTVSAQQSLPTNDIPRTISYQGQLTNSNGSPLIDGSYQITISLCANPDGTNPVWQETYNTSLSGGIFNLYLGSGNNPLPDAAVLNQPLWVATRIGDGLPMSPLTPLSASPYALNVSDKSITNGKLADGAVTAEKVDMEYVSGVEINDRKVAGVGTMLKLKSSEDIRLDYDETTNSITIAANKETQSKTTGDAEKTGKGPSVLDATDVNDNWLGRVTGTNPPFFGTSPLGLFNTLAGGESNTIGSSTEHSAIVGGLSNAIAVAANFCFIGGGETNSVDGFHSSIVGGDNQSINAANSAIVGGSGNIITGNSSTIAGGGQINTPNTINGSASFIGAGNGNLIDVSAVESAIIAGNFNIINPSVSTSMIGAGTDNVIDEFSFSNFIGAGFLNRIDSNVESSFIGSGQENFIDDSSHFSVIGGGSGNQAQTRSHHGVIGGGENNSIGSDGEFSTIAGGTRNRIIGNSDFNFIGGGDSNAVTGDWSSVVGGNLNVVNGAFSAIAGGLGNSVTGSFSTIAGGGDGLLPNVIEADNSFIGSGVNNRIEDLGVDNGIVAGNYNRIDGSVVGVMIGAGSENNIQLVSDFSFIGAGHLNVIHNNSEGSVLVGGEGNHINPGSHHGMIGGGTANQVLEAEHAVIGGGEQNNVVANHSFIGGGESNAITALVGGSHGVIAGGESNFVSGDHSAVLGGGFNTAFGGQDFIGGGLSNQIVGDKSVIAGGQSNNVQQNFGTIGGGESNTIGADFSTIPGGQHLSTTAYAQTAVGFFNAPRGTLTSNPTILVRNRIDDPLFMVGNGQAPAPFPILSNAFEVSTNGHSVVFDVNGSSQVGNPLNRTPFRGATYTDNIIYAWGDIAATGAINSDFGVASVTNPAPGVFTVTIRINNPTTGAPITLASAAIVATLVNEGPTAQCGSILCTRIGTPAANQFQVRTNGASCEPVNLPFMFHLTGR